MTNRLFLRCLLALLCGAAVLFWIGRYTNTDLYLADAMFDFSTNSFPWREQWFTANFMHHTMKALMFGIGMVPVVALIADSLFRRTLIEERIRRGLWVVVAASVLIPVTISLIKSTSMHHCPWSLVRYGGFAPYLRILDSLPAGVTAGYCFPAGHASSGLWIASVAAFWLPEKPTRAIAAFGAGLIPGLCLGWSQQMRGAHFLTHTLWSAWIAALIILVLARLLCRRPSAADTTPANITVGAAASDG